MQLYGLRYEANEEAGTFAYLECYDRPRAYFFELASDVDPWDLPFILHEFARREVSTVDATWSRRWVESRLVPPERQNLGEVHAVPCEELREAGTSLPLGPDDLVSLVGHSF